MSQCALLAHYRFLQISYVGISLKFHLAVWLFIWCEVFMCLTFLQFCTDRGSRWAGFQGYHCIKAFKLGTWCRLGTLHLDILSEESVCAYKDHAGLRSLETLASPLFNKWINRTLHDLQGCIKHSTSQSLSAFIHLFRNHGEMSQSTPEESKKGKKPIDIETRRRVFVVLVRLEGSTGCLVTWWSSPVERVQDVNGLAGARTKTRHYS